MSTVMNCTMNYKGSIHERLSLWGAKLGRESPLGQQMCEWNVSMKCCSKKDWKDFVFLLLQYKISLSLMESAAVSERKKADAQAKDGRPWSLIPQTALNQERSFVNSWYNFMEKHYNIELYSKSHLRLHEIWKMKNMPCRGTVNTSGLCIIWDEHMCFRVSKISSKNNFFFLQKCISWLRALYRWCRSPHTHFHSPQQTTFRGGNW